MRSLLILLIAGLIVAGSPASAPVATAAEPAMTWSPDGQTLTITAPMPAPMPAPQGDSPEVEAAETPPLEATAENQAASVPNARFGRALKRAALLLRFAGKINRETRLQIVQFVDCPERTTADGEVVDLLEQVKSATVEQMVEGGQRGVGFDFMELIQIIIDNWETIYQFIQLLLDLFAQNAILVAGDQVAFGSPGLPPPEYAMAV